VWSELRVAQESGGIVEQYQSVGGKKETAPMQPSL
jgi:hypothetical protein